MDEFEYQLRAEKEERQKKGGDTDANNAATYTDPTDGTVYEWDSQKNGWFPKIDSDFLAAYQASYGYGTADSTNDSSSNSNPTMTTAVAAASQLVDHVTMKGEDKATTPTGEDRKRKAQPEVAEWFELNETKNTNVYVSGLPLDVTLDEFKELMQQKGGIIALDDEGAPKVKLYSDEEGHLKGDGLCCYLKVESVGLAIQLLHESKYRDKMLHVERAKFWVKGEYNPELKKKKKKGKKKKVNVQEKLLDWRERKKQAGHKRMAHEKVVVLKHVFDPKEFEEEPTLINDIRDDMTTECGKYGTVKKCLIYDRHPEGVVSVVLKEFEGADACVQALNGRWFAGRQLSAANWDGTTQYDVEETTEEREKRLKQWEQFLTSDVQNELDNHFNKALSSPAENAASQSTTSLLSSTSSSSLLPPLSASPLQCCSTTSPLQLVSPYSTGQMSSPTFNYPPIFPGNSPSTPSSRMRLQILHPEMSSYLIYPDIDTFHDLPKVPGQSDFPGPPPKVQLSDSVVYPPSFLASPGLTPQAGTVPYRPAMVDMSPRQPMSYQNRLLSWDWQDYPAAAAAPASNSTQPLPPSNTIMDGSYHSNHVIPSPNLIW